MKYGIGKSMIFACSTIVLNGNVLIYNHTPQDLTVSFYYGDVPAKMEFVVKPGEGYENAIPGMKVGNSNKRTLKIADKDSTITLGPYNEWFSNKVFYIVSKDHILKSYTQKEWDILPMHEKKGPVKKNDSSFWNVFSFGKDQGVGVQEEQLQDKIPLQSNNSKWIMIKNDCGKTMYCSFYYYGTLSGALTRASSMVYRVNIDYGGYALLPQQNFLAKGPRMVVYADKKEVLSNSITKKDQSRLEGMVKVGFGQESVINLISKEKKLLQEIKKRPLKVILKTATPLYCAFYIPEYQSWGDTLKKIFQTNNNKKVESFKKLSGPEQMTVGKVGTFEVSDDTILVISDNIASISSSVLTRSTLDTSKDITYALCHNNEYLIIAKTSGGNFIYTLDQWRNSVPVKSDLGQSYKEMLLKWVIRKFLNKGKK